MKKSLLPLLCGLVLFSISLNSFSVNAANGLCTAPEGYTLIECADNRTVGDALLVYKAENTQSATTAVVAADPVGGANKAILFSNKNWGHYLQLQVTLPCNRTLGDYEAISFRVVCPSGIGTYQNIKVGVNQNLFDVANNGDNTLTSWTTIERAFPGGFSNYSSLNTFTLELGFRTNTKDFYFDDILLKEKAGLPPCGVSNLTVLLNPGTGSCSVASVTETEADAGVVLPVASPSAKCVIVGYTFAGWSETVVIETSELPALIPAGHWQITANTTLYAVYTNGAVYNSNPMCRVSLNGTVTNRWLMVEDFESMGISNPLVMENIYGEAVVGTASVVANPTIADENSAQVIITSGNYNTFLRLDVTLPEGKLLSHYEKVAFDLYRMAGDANYKKMSIWIDGQKVFEDASFIQQAPAVTWTAKTYDLSGLPSVNSFKIVFGISTDAGNFLIDNLRLFEKEIVNTFTVTFNPGAGVAAIKALTENTSSSGVVLPGDATPSAECVAGGWALSGWSALQVQRTNEEPSYYAPGSTYFPSNNVVLYAVYSDGVYFDTYPSTAVSAKGSAVNGYWMIEDFETMRVGTPFTLYNTGGNPQVGSATVVVNPTNNNERAVNIVTSNYENILELDVTLPNGKTMSDFDELMLDFYWSTNDWKKMNVWVDGVMVYEDNDYISQAQVNQWTVKSYTINAASENSFQLAVGVSTDNGNYLLDNLRLKAKVTTNTAETASERYVLKGTRLLLKDLASVCLYDLRGELLMSQSNTRFVEFSALTQGMYIIKIVVDGQLFVEKFLR